MPTTRDVTCSVRTALEQKQLNWKSDPTQRERKNLPEAGKFSSIDRDFAHFLTVKFINIMILFHYQIHNFCAAPISPREKIFINISEYFPNGLLV